MGGYIGVGVVLLILGFGLAFLIIDIRNRINNEVFSVRLSYVTCT